MPLYSLIHLSTIIIEADANKAIMANAADTASVVIIRSSVSLFIVLSFIFNMFLDCLCDLLAVLLPADRHISLNQSFWL